MKAVILAGGFGTRLSEETDRVPKPMVTIGGMPILWHIMKCYSHHGINEFVICLGYKSHIIKEFFQNYALRVSDIVLDLTTGSVDVLRPLYEPWRVTLVDTGLHTETGGRLKRIAGHLGNEPFCCTYGDGLGNIDIAASIAFHRRHGKLATVAAVAPPGRFGSMELDGDRVIHFLEKATFHDNLINGGFFVLDPKVLEYIEDDATIWERGPLERLAFEGQLIGFRHTGFWQPMDTLRDRRKLQELWDSGNAPWKVWP